MLLEMNVLILSLSRRLKTIILLLVCILKCIHKTKIILYVCLDEYMLHILCHQRIDGSAVSIVWLEEHKSVLSKRLVLRKRVLWKRVLRRRILATHCTHCFTSFIIYETNKNFNFQFLNK